MFKIPRVVFNGSEVFRHMLDLPQSVDRPTDGSAEAYPLCLEGHTAADFRQLLRVLLPL